MDVYRRPDGGPRVTRDEQLLFEGAGVAVGIFDARPEDPHFRCSGPPGEHLFVFPSTSVRIEHDGGPSFVADRHRVTFYNPDELYYRSALSPRGDRGHWFAVGPEVLEEAVGGRRRRSRQTARWETVVGPVDAATYRCQSELVRRLAGGDPVEPLEVEEGVLDLARRVVGPASRPEQRAVTEAHIRLAEEARAALALSYTSPRPLSQLAASVGASSYHLARVFRAVTGTTLHRHREQLRLRRACLELPERAGDLLGLALDLGYSSHSHFTAAFRRTFGAPPSRWSRRRV